MSATKNKPLVTTGILLILFSVFFGITFALLGTTIHWPTSLGEDASEVLPVILENHTWVVLGYYSFLVSSLLLVPMALFVRRTLASDSPWADVAVAFAGLAAVFKILGIFRWLFLMPGLATDYASPQTSPAARQTIEELFRAFNLYTDGFGTHLGDQLFTGLWIGVLGGLLLRNRRTRWLGVLGLLVLAAQVFGCVTDFFSRPNPYLSAVQSVVYLWVTLLGVLHLTNRKLWGEK